MQHRDEYVNQSPGSLVEHALAVVAGVKPAAILSYNTETDFVDGSPIPAKALLEYLKENGIEYRTYPCRGAGTLTADGKIIPSNMVIGIVVADSRERADELAELCQKADDITHHAILTGQATGISVDELMQKHRESGAFAYYDIQMGRLLGYPDKEILIYGKERDGDIVPSKQAFDTAVENARERLAKTHGETQKSQIESGRNNDGITC